MTIRILMAPSDIDGAQSVTALIVGSISLSEDPSEDRTVDRAAPSNRDYGYPIGGRNTGNGVFITKGTRFTLARLVTPFWHAVVQTAHSASQRLKPYDHDARRSLQCRGWGLRRPAACCPHSSAMLGILGMAHGFGGNTPFTSTVYRKPQNRNYTQPQDKHYRLVPYTRFDSRV